MSLFWAVASTDDDLFFFFFLVSKHSVTVKCVIPAENGWLRMSFCGACAIDARMSVSIYVQIAGSVKGIFGDPGDDVWLGG